MKNACADLVAISGITLFALVSVIPASADSGRYHRQYHSYNRREKHDHWHHRNRPEIVFGSRRGHYFGNRWERYFGVGPDSYECYGYDCNW